jgi:hypothetical protein
VRRLFELLGLVDPGLGHPDEVLRFVRAERVLARSIRDDFLGNTETRVALYDGLAGLPLEFNDRFQQEFCVSPFLNKDEFVAASLSKFLVARKVPHNRAMHGTFLFEGLEDVLQKFVPRSLKELSNWLFERG